VTSDAVIKDFNIFEHRLPHFFARGKAVAMQAIGVLSQQLPLRLIEVHITQKIYALRRNNRASSVVN
jgi:hypothetical protein